MTKKREKILYIQPNNNHSGSCRVLLTLIQDYYRESNYKVITMGTNGFLSQLPPKNIIYLRYPRFFGKILHGPSYALYCIKLFFVSLFYGFTYRHFYVNTIMPFPAVIAGRLLRCQVTYHVHEKFITPDFKQKFAEWILTHVKANRIYVSNYLKTAYDDHRNSSKVEFNRLSKDFIASIRIRPYNERKRNTLLLVSALPSKQKGIDLYYQLAKACPEYTFYLITELPKEQVYKFLSAPNLSNLIIEKGGKEVNIYYEISDIILNLSNPFWVKETFGMTILEGMAYGLPAIVPNEGGPTELVIDGYNGYQVNVTNIGEVKKKIDNILNKKNYATFCENSITMFKKLNS